MLLPQNLHFMQPEEYHASPGKLSQMHGTDIIWCPYILNPGSIQILSQWMVSSGTEGVPRVPLLQVMHLTGATLL